MDEGTPRRQRSRGPIRILLVEDAPADADLMLRTLRRAGLEVEAHVVQEESEYRRALQEFRPDVVLADNKLPRFSGRRALRIARRHDPFLPVIMVTGTLQEERIIRLTQLGLANYVLKDHLLRLTPAVLDALDHAEVRRATAEAQRALADRERRFRAVAEASGDGLMIIDEHGKIVFWNAAAERLFGYATSEALGTHVRHLAAARFRKEQATFLAKALTAPTLPEPFTIEVAALRKDGTEFPAELTVSGWEEDGHRLFSAEVRDITLRKEEARTRLVLSQAIEQTVTSVVITDVDGTIQYVNPAFERLTGYAAHEVLGQNPRILRSGKHPLAFYEDMWARLTAGQVFQGEFTNRRKDGSEYQQESTIFPVIGADGRIERFVGLGKDVTQERLLEAQLRQSQKMEAVGQLAAGIAHDFNNVLTGVLTNAQLLEFALPEGPSEQCECLEDLVAAARRGAALVKRLMSLARRDAGAPSRADVRGVVDEAMKTIRRILPESIEIRVEHPPRELACMVDDGDLQQALFNLATNARDAMPGGGRLAVRTLEAEGRAVIEVQDNGSGMEPEVLERIFEPFFTTKDVGKGTGLGLAMVYGFVKRSGGTVTAQSRRGVGTTIRLALPLAPADVPAGDAPRPAEAAPVLSAAHGTVLVAEDEADVRRVAQRALERLGFRVLTAADGVEAMTILGRERGRIDLVLSDLVMPRGGGAMLYRNTLEWPDRPRFLLMSGHAPSEVNGDRDLVATLPFLPKPWTIADLETAVSRVLEAPVS